MPHVLGPRLRERGRDPSRGEQLSVQRRAATPRVVPLVEVAELHTEDGRLQRVQTAVEALDLVHVLLALPVVTGQSEPVEEILVARHHRAGIAERTEVLARIEAERCRVTERARAEPLVARAVR